MRFPFLGVAVVESSAEQTDTGSVVAEVRWTDGDGIRRVRSVEMSAEEAQAGTVQLVVDPSGGVRVVDPSEGFGSPVTALMIAALVGLGFALVVLASVRGLGYVRGTGSYGETDPREVEESHAFYWRH